MYAKQKTSTSDVWYKLQNQSNPLPQQLEVVKKYQHVLIACNNTHSHFWLFIYARRD